MRLRQDGTTHPGENFQTAVPIVEQSRGLSMSKLQYREAAKHPASNGSLGAGGIYLVRALIGVNRRLSEKLKIYCQSGRFDQVRFDQFLFCKKTYDSKEQQLPEK